MLVTTSAHRLAQRSTLKMAQSMLVRASALDTDQTRRRLCADARKDGPVDVSLKWGNRDGGFNSGAGFAARAGGAVVGRDQDTILLVTACLDRSDESRHGTKIAQNQNRKQTRGGMKLGVEYRSRSVAGGSFPAHATRRELMPSAGAQIIARRVDAAMRPMISGFDGSEVQVICSELSANGSGDAPALAVNAASVALCLASCTNKWFKGPLGCVRVRAQRPACGGDIEFVEFPEAGKLAIGERTPIAVRVSTENSKELAADIMVKPTVLLDLLLTGTGPDNIVALDFSSSEPIEEDLVCKAIRFAANRLPDVLQSQRKFLHGADPEAFPLTGDMHSRESAPQAPWHGAPDSLSSALYENAKQVFSSATGFGDDPLRKASHSTLQHLREGASTCPNALSGTELAFGISHAAARDCVRQEGLSDRNALGLRGMSANLDLLHGAHGSASFSQGHTSCFATATVAPLDHALSLVEPNNGGRISEDESYSGGQRAGQGTFTSRSFIAHFDLPASASGEFGRGGTARRLVTTGELIRKALSPSVPEERAWPYCVRVFCEAIRADGSAAMAAVTAASIAMRSAGIPTKALVAGVTMGLIRRSMLGTERNTQVIIADMDATEERLSEMELQVAGTQDGVTAMQLDSSSLYTSAGIDMDTLCIAITDSAPARRQILDISTKELVDFAETCTHGKQGCEDFFPRPDHVPYVESIELAPHQVLKLLGPGGARVKVLREVLNVGIVVDRRAHIAHVYGADEHAVLVAREEIGRLFWIPDEGAVFEDCTVTSHMSNAAVVRFSENRQEGTVHISEVDIKRVDSVKEALPLGTKLCLKVIGISEDGRVRLSRRAILMDTFLRDFNALEEL